MSVHLAAWVVSTGVAIACCVAVYYLAENNLEVTRVPEAAGAEHREADEGRDAGGEREVDPATQTGSIGISWKPV